jgi:hypothetical protein
VLDASTGLAARHVGVPRARRGSRPGRQRRDERFRSWTAGQQVQPAAEAGVGVWRRSLRGAAAGKGDSARSRLVKIAVFVLVGLNLNF